MKDNEYLIKTLVDNGVALQNAVNAYSAQVLTAIGKIEAMLMKLTLLESKLNGIANELITLRRESALENKRMRRAISYKKTRRKKR